MYTIQSAHLNNPHHYISDNPELLHSLVEAAIMLSNSGYPSYLEPNEEPFNYHIINLSTGDVHNTPRIVTGDQTLLQLIQTIATSDLTNADRITIRDQFPTLLEQMENCSELDDLYDFAPTMLVALIQYAQLINQPYHTISAPPESMTLSLFAMRIGYVLHVNTHFTELIDYFIDFCDYCFDVHADDLLTLTLHTLLDAHLTYGQLLHTKIS